MTTTGIQRLGHTTPAVPCRSRPPDLRCESLGKRAAECTDTVARTMPLTQAPDTARLTMQQAICRTCNSGLPEQVFRTCDANPSARGSLNALMLLPEHAATTLSLLEQHVVPCWKQIAGPATPASPGRSANPQHVPQRTLWIRPVAAETADCRTETYICEVSPSPTKRTNPLQALQLSCKMCRYDHCAVSPQPDQSLCSQPSTTQPTLQPAELNTHLRSGYDHWRSGQCAACQFCLTKHLAVRPQRRSRQCSMLN